MFIFAGGRCVLFVQRCANNQRRWWKKWQVPRGNGGQSGSQVETPQGQVGVRFLLPGQRQESESAEVEGNAVLQLRYVYRNVCGIRLS